MKQLFIVILSTFLIVCGIFYVNIQVLKKEFTKENINKSIEQVNLVDLLKYDYDGDPLTPTGMEKFYTIAKEENIPTKIIDEFVNSNIAKKFIILYVDNISDYLFNGTIKNINGSDLRRITDISIDNMVGIDGIPISNLSKKVIHFLVNQYSDEIVSLLPTTEEILTVIDPKSQSMIQLIFSKQLSYICIGFSLFVIMIIAIITHSLYKFLLYHGITNVIISLFSYIMSYSFIDIFVQSSMNDNILVQKFLMISSESIEHSFYSFGNIFMVSAFVQITLYFVIYYITQMITLHKNVNSNETKSL